MENFDFEAIIGTVTDFIGGIDWEGVLAFITEKIVPVITDLFGGISL
jgi:hypothetical protein